MPAKAICISEIWPTRPVTTTTERPMITVISETEIAAWYVLSRSTRARTTIADAHAEAAGPEHGVAGASGSRARDSVPRAGISAPPMIIISATITNGSAWLTPGCVQYSTSRDCPTPMLIATAVVMPNEVKRPTSAAASAGSTSSVSGAMSTVVSGAIITPAKAASMHPSAQLRRRSHRASSRAATPPARSRRPLASRCRTP